MVDEENSVNCRYFHFGFGLLSIIMSIALLVLTCFVDRPLYEGIIVALSILVSGILAIIGAWKKNRNFLIAALGIDFVSLTSATFYVFLQEVTFAIANLRENKEEPNTYWIFVSFLAIVGILLIIHATVSGIDIGCQECKRSRSSSSATTNSNLQTQVMTIQYNTTILPGQPQNPVVVQYPNYQYIPMNANIPAQQVSESPPPYTEKPRN